MEPETGYTVSTVRQRRRGKRPPEIRDPKAVYELVRPLVQAADREHFYAVYLNTRHQVLAVDLVSVGSLNASIVHPREVYKRGIVLSAAALLVVHNHPSGETEPSEDDLAITRRLQEAGSLLGIPLLDHLILGRTGYRSLKEEGRL